jgi:hypothetical protein
LTLVENLNWFLRRVMYVFSPLPLVAGLAAVVQGRFGFAVLLFLIALTLLLGGRQTRGQRRPPVV